MQRVTELRARVAVLVEGWSDEAALAALAARHGWDLKADRIALLPIGGITNLPKFAAALGPAGLQLPLAGLYDEAEQRYVARALQRLGLACEASNGSLEALGFFVCRADLEDELIRALGTEAVEQVLDTQGELASFRRFQEQPAQRGRELQARLHRFMGTRALRKVRYGTLLVDALPLAQMPRPLDAVLRLARCF